MTAYHLAAPSFFKPKTQVSRVDSVLVSALPEVAQVHIREQTTSDTIYRTSKVTIDGKDDAISLSQDSSSTPSTDLLSDVSSPERLSRWPPGPFPVPTFVLDVELKLKYGNAEYEKKNRHLKLMRAKARHFRNACIYFIWF